MGMMQDYATLDAVARRMSKHYSIEHVHANPEAVVAFTEGYMVAMGWKFTGNMEVKEIIRYITENWF